MAVTKRDELGGTNVGGQYPSERMLEYIMDFCFMVEDRLEELGMTRSELARRLGRKPSSVTRVLSGSANVTLQTIAEYDAALGLDIKLTCGAQEGGRISFSAPPQKSPSHRTWGDPAGRKGWRRESSEQAHTPRAPFRSLSFVGEVAA